MTNENKELSPGEREKFREVSLNLLKSGIGDIAAAYLIEQSGYGTPANTDAELILYASGVASGSWMNALNKEMFQKNILESRVNGRPYAGGINIKDSEILESCTQRFMQSLINVKFGDIVELMDYKIPEELQGKYNSLKNSYIYELDEKTQKDILGTYQTYFIKSKLAEASGQSAGTIRDGTLEKILKEDKKE